MAERPTVREARRRRAIAIAMARLRQIGTPPYWINMGAMAITAVAGARLLGVAKPSAFLTLLRPFIEGFTVMMWAWGTWWIPLLLIIGVWKYVARREPVRYHPALWSIVFPLGMYATALHLLSHLAGLTFLAAIAPASSWLAFAAWVLVAVAWLLSAVSAMRPAPHSRTPQPDPTPHRSRQRCP